MMEEPSVCIPNIFPCLHLVNGKSGWEKSKQEANQKALLYISWVTETRDLPNLKLSKVQTSLHFFFTCTQKSLTQEIPEIILMLQSLRENIRASFAVLKIDK